VESQHDQRRGETKAGHWLVGQIAPTLLTKHPDHQAVP
jgi:hypothetical protein